MNTRQILLIFIAIILVGCGAQAAPTAQPTAAPTDEPEEATEEVDEDDEDDLGEMVFNQFYEEAGFACVTCHYPDTENRLLGPGLLTIEDRFETYEVDAEDIEDYIRQSIVDPRAFIVPDESPYPENIMPLVYGDVLSEDELDALVEYILSF